MTFYIAAAADGHTDLARLMRASPVACNVLQVRACVCVWCMDVLVDAFVATCCERHGLASFCRRHKQPLLASCLYAAGLKMMSSSYSSLDWVLSHWVHFTVHSLDLVAVSYTHLTLPTILRV